MAQHMMYNFTQTSQQVRLCHVISETSANNNPEWVSGDHGAVAQWDYDHTSDGIAYHRVWRQQQLPFSEINQQADWGNWYWATKYTPNLSFQSGSDTAVRGAFKANGWLPNTEDYYFRPINQQWPVFGFASNLGSVTGPVSTLYAIGLTQEQAIQFDGETGVVPLASLWTSYFASETDAVSTHPPCGAQHFEDVVAISWFISI